MNSICSGTCASSTTIGGNKEITPGPTLLINLYINSVPKRSSADRIKYMRRKTQKVVSKREQEAVTKKDSAAADGIAFDSLRAGNSTRSSGSGVSKFSALLAVWKRTTSQPGAEKDSTHHYAAAARRIRSSAAWLCDNLEKAAAVACAWGDTPENLYLTGNYAPVDESGPVRPLVVEGTIPACLNGEFLQVAPNPRHKPVSNYHWFDGDGMIHGLRIRDGEVTYVSRYVRTSRFTQEEYWEGSKFLKVGDMKGVAGVVWASIYMLRIMLRVLDESNGAGTANTAMVYHSNQLLALHERDMPYSVRVHEDGDLETIGRLGYDGKLTHCLTAHPKVDPTTGEMFTFGYEVFRPPYATYRVVSKGGIMGEPVALTLPRSSVMHDFAITERFAIFMQSALHFSFTDMVVKNRGIFAADETTALRFGVLPRYARSESQIRWFELSPGVVFHSVNAWEEGDELVIIAFRASATSSLKNLEMTAFPKNNNQKLENTKADLWQYRLNMRTGEAHERRLGDFVTEFPAINSEYVGRKNRYVYANIFHGSVMTRIVGIVKYDLTLEPAFGRKDLEIGGNIIGTVWHGEDRTASEAVFVPSNELEGAAEDDGYLMYIVFDEQSQKSEMIIIDAKTMSSTPVAVVKLPKRVPYGIHALFLNEEQIWSQKS